MSHKLTTLLATLLVALTIGAARISARVSNVNVTYTADKAVITYDLDTESDVRVLVSWDGGLTYASALNDVTGDVGPAVGPGRGLRIECAPGREYPDRSRGRLRLKVFADNPGIFTLTPRAERVNSGADNTVAYVIKTADGTLLNRQVYAEVGDTYGFKVKTGNLIPVKGHDGKWGAIDLDGRQILPMTYDGVYVCADGLVKVRQGDRYGFADRTGNFVIPIRYSSLSSAMPGYVIADLDSGGKLCTTDGRPAGGGSIRYDQWFGPIFLSSENSGGQRLYDASRREYVTPSYESLVIEGDLTWCYKNGRQGWLSTLTGEVVIPAVYDNAYNFYGEDYTYVERNGVWSIIDRKGRTVFTAPAGYDFGSNPFADVEKGYYKLRDKSTGKQGLADASATFIIPPRYDEIYKQYKGDVFNACIREAYDVVASHVYNVRKGRLILDYGKEYSLWFVDTDGNVVLKNNTTGRYALYDSDGNLMLADLHDINGSKYSKYGEYMPYYLVVADKGGPRAIYDATRRKYVTAPIIESLLSTATGDGVLVYDTVDDRVLFFDTADGTFFISDLGSGSFGGGEGKVWISSGYGRAFKRRLVDSKGNVIPNVVGEDYSLVEGYHDGVCRVQNSIDGKWGYIDLEGNELFPCVLESCSDFSGGLGRICKNGRYGYVDTKGRLLIPAIYDAASDFENGIAVVGIDGSYGAIDSKGREVIPCYYSSDFVVRNKVGLKGLVYD